MNIKFDYIALLASFAALAVSIIKLNPYLIALCAIIALISLCIHKLWKFIEASIFRHTNFIELSNGYQISGSRSAAIRTIKDGKFCATSVALLTKRSEQQIDRDKIEAIISRLNIPFKYVMQVEKMDLNRILDRLQTRIGMKEIELSRLDKIGKDSARSNQIKRELELMNEELRSITSGGIPLNLAHYLYASHISERRYEAEELASHKVMELASEFDAVIGSKSELITGEDMINALNIEVN